MKKKPRKIQGSHKKEGKDHPLQPAPAVDHPLQLSDQPVQLSDHPLQPAPVVDHPLQLSDHPLQPAPALDQEARRTPGDQEARRTPVQLTWRRRGNDWRQRGW